jgi:hypothetical protein
MPWNIPVDCTMMQWDVQVGNFYFPFDKLCILCSVLTTVWNYLYPLLVISEKQDVHSGSVHLTVCICTSVASAKSILGIVK